jgi:6-pyruvoyltetrahydropterin/6-carboxytetrahydropterin synthase
MLLNMRYRFEAAHRLPQHRGMCRHLHGHSYGLRVSLEVTINPETGMGCDFSDVDEVVQEKVLARADHRNLNDFIENPTAEMISIWIWEQLEGALPGRLVEIEVHETENCSCVYRGPGPGGEST